MFRGCITGVPLHRFRRTSHDTTLLRDRDDRLSLLPLPSPYVPRPSSLNSDLLAYVPRLPTLLRPSRARPPPPVRRLLGRKGSSPSGMLNSRSRGSPPPVRRLRQQRQQPIGDVEGKNIRQVGVGMDDGVAKRRVFCSLRTGKGVLKNSVHPVHHVHSCKPVNKLHSHCFLLCSVTNIRGQVSTTWY